jgi:alpha-L-arabinofuranosidase
MKLFRYAAVGIGTMFGIFAASAAIAAPQVSITIDAAKPGPVISRNVYGQFAEHLGTGIYGGMWVGPESAIPNTRGWRSDVVDALKDLHVPVVRWPGGCFADLYHWRDGIGPRDKRPTRINVNWGGVEENNAVGTHEFFDLAEQIGADAYISGNMGSGTVQEMAEWVEYLTADGNSSLALQRAENGHPAPYKVAFFGVGNETWGCGGAMSVQHYTDLYNQYATFLKAPKGTQFIASGGTGNEHDPVLWTDYISAHVPEQWTMRFDGISFHYYTLLNNSWKKMGVATGFGEGDWIEILQQTLRMDKLIADNVAKLDKNDPKKKLTFAVDEWGTWYESTPGSKPGFLQQQNTLRDAIVAALNFNIFHAHADRVRLANVAQMVNVLQAMILTDKGKMVLTPTYHAFKMYVPFQDAASLPVKLANNPRYTFGKKNIPAVSASAARGKDGKLYLALVNANPKEAIDVAIDVAGTTATSVSGSVLTAAAMDAHNAVAAPTAVTPAPFQAKANDGKLIVKLPAKAIVVVAVNG